jgi:hypothetical protein
MESIDFTAAFTPETQKMSDIGKTQPEVGQRILFLRTS